MKTRSDFVSNSSSSSFVIINSDGMDETEHIRELFSIYTEDNPYKYPCQDYKYEFGWEWEDTYEFGGKLNFIGLQLLYLYEMTLEGSSFYYHGEPGVDFTKFSGMIKKVCKERFGFTAELDTSLVEEHKYKNEAGEEESFYSIADYMYIDHQSCATENRNLEMFESEGALINFLADGSSYIKGGNDNEDPQ